MRGLRFKINEIQEDFVQNYSGKDNVNYGCSMRGAWRALQCMKNDVAIVIHGPKGCNNEFKLDYEDTIAKTYCTEMTENDVITGGLGKLEKLIFDLDKRPDISLIVILTTCTSELIGEDIDTLLQNLKNKTTKKCFVLHTSGISGMVQSDGHNMVISNLIKKYTSKNNEKIKNSINYIGYSWPFDHRAGRDMHELNRILDELGIKLNGVYTSNLGFSEIKEASRASLNVVRCPGSAYGTINFMKENFNIPYLKLPIPVGLKNTTDFFSKLIDYFGLGNEKKQILRSYEEFVCQKLSLYKEILKSKKACVAVGANRTLYLVEALLELELEVKVISFYRIHETIGDSVVKIAGKTFENLERLRQRYNLDCEVWFTPIANSFTIPLRKTPWTLSLTYIQIGK